MTTTIPLAERLETAARLLRGAATGATPGPWRRAADAGVLGDNYPANFIANWDGEYLRVASAGEGDQAETDARYITRMNPEVGRALAELLADAADAAEIVTDDPPSAPPPGDAETNAGQALLAFRDLAAHGRAAVAAEAAGDPDPLRWLRGWLAGHGLAPPAGTPGRRRPVAAGGGGGESGGQVLDLAVPAVRRVRRRSSRPARRRGASEPPPPAARGSRPADPGDSARRRHPEERGPQLRSRSGGPPRTPSRWPPDDGRSNASRRRGLRSPPADATPHNNPRSDAKEQRNNSDHPYLR